MDARLSKPLELKIPRLIYHEKLKSWRYAPLDLSLIHILEEDWACEARRYYIGIVGKYGVQVQNLLKKASGLDIQIICPLHGPVLTENLGYYLNLYQTWSSYAAETEGIVIAYTSVYGHTKKAVETLADKLLKEGCQKVVAVSYTHLTF